MKKILKRIINYFSNKFYLKRQADTEFNPVIYYSLKSENKFLKIIGVFLPFFIRKRLSILITNSRIVEEPFVFMNLDFPKESKILDLGCCYSKISLQLASLGCKVTGVDLNKYNYRHPNFEFIRKDFLEVDFPDDYFDCVLSVSTIEHIGLDCYGGKVIEGGDKKTVEKIYRILKKGGKFIITVPFGKAKLMEGQRVYDENLLGQLLSSFQIEKEKYFSYKEGSWLSAEKSFLADIDFSDNSQGVALLVCKKYE